MVRIIEGKKSVKEGIIAIGQSLIERAEDITKDLEEVISITIYAKLNPSEVVNFEITKNYTARIKEDNKE